MNATLAGQQRTDNASSVEAVTEWAVGTGAGMYQLPLPHYHFAEAPTAEPNDQAAAEAREYDSERLEFVFGQLDVYRAGGYAVRAAVAIEEDFRDTREDEWWQLFSEVAQAHGWEQLPVLTVPLNAVKFDDSGTKRVGTERVETES